MTLMNNTYRRPRTKHPQPFDYDANLPRAGVLECFGVQEREHVQLPVAVSMDSCREFISARWEDGIRTAPMLAPLFV